MSPAVRSVAGPVRFSVLVYLVLLAFLGLGLFWPLVQLVIASFETKHGQWAGLANFADYAATPGLVTAFFHTLGMGFLATAATLVLAFILSYSFTHTCMQGKSLCRMASMLPLFVPSLFPALGLIYGMGSQGILSEYIEDIPLYGPLGIFLGAVLYALPHATLLLTSTLRDIDSDLYVASRTLGAGAWRRFYTVTLPGARYGLTSAGIVVFVLTITDFGIPKVLGGNFSMLATEIYIQIAGMQNIPMGATVSLVLLLPAFMAFLCDRWAHARQRGKNKGHPYLPQPAALRDRAFTLAGWCVAAVPLLVVGLACFGAFVRFWPYDLALTLDNFAFRDSVYGIAPFWNSLQLAAYVAFSGTVIISCGAYLTERSVQPVPCVAGYRLLALLPLGIPGTVLGLAYILAFNTGTGVFSFLSGGMVLLVFNTVIHFFTVCHLNACGGFLRMPQHYEVAGATLGVPLRRTLARVIFPLQRPLFAETAFYLFVNAMTTISAVVFLYSPETIPASVAILQLMDSGRIAEASAMGTLILLVCLAVKALFSLVERIHCFSRRASVS